MMIIGHRGAAGLAAENSLSSFTKAQDLKVDMIEMDVRRDRTGRLVLRHDFDPQRIYSGAVELTQGLVGITIPVNLDIKESGFEAEVLEAIKSFPYKVLITSWNVLVLKKFRTLDRNILLGMVLGRKYGFFLPSILRVLRKFNISWITIDVALINERSMRQIKKFGWQAYAFTNDDPKMFNDQQNFQRLKNLGVTGIFADYPDIVSKLN